MSQFATASEFRSFGELSGTTGRKSDTNLDILLQSASDWLERTTHRTITASASNTAKTFSTNGQPSIVIPDLRVATTVTLQTVALVDGTTYWLKPDNKSPEIYTRINVRAWGQGRGYSYLSNPEWFDHNLDSPLSRYYGTLPNDLVITGLWGWTSTPPEWKLATLALAFYHYNHADAMFSSARATPEGSLLDLSKYPSEVQALVRDWSLGEQVVLT